MEYVPEVVKSVSRLKSNTKDVPLELSTLPGVPKSATTLSAHTPA